MVSSVCLEAKMATLGLHRY